MSISFTKVWCTLYHKKYLLSKAPLSTFTSLTAKSYSTCSLMANTMGKLAFVWQKDEKKCLVGDKVPGKKLFTIFKTLRLALTSRPFC